MSTKRRSFGPVYRELSLCGRDISPAAKLVLIHLLERLGTQDRNRENTWPTLMTIGEGIGFDRRTVQRALDDLKDLGFVTWRRRGRGESNLYTVQIEAIDRWMEARKSGQNVPSGDEGDAPRDDKMPLLDGDLSPLPDDKMPQLDGEICPTEDPSGNGLQEEPSEEDPVDDKTSPSPGENDERDRPSDFQKIMELYKEDLRDRPDNEYPAERCANRWGYAAFKAAHRWATNAGKPPWPAYIEEYLEQHEATGHYGFETFNDAVMRTLRSEYPDYDVDGAVGEYMNRYDNLERAHKVQFFRSIMDTNWRFREKWAKDAVRP